MDPNFKSNHPSLGNYSIPISVKNQLWEEMYLVHFEYDGKSYYIDNRYESPYGYEYDFWSYNGPNEIQGRVVHDQLVDELTNHVNRQKKIKKILGKIE